MKKKLRILEIAPPSGVTMTEDECKALCEKCGKEYLKGYEERILQYVTTSEIPDRMGDIVRVSGADFSNYQKNPVVMFAHDHQNFPVGAALRIWIDEANKTIPAHALFLDNRVDSSGRSDLVFKFAKSKFLPACSIGFLPKEINKPVTQSQRDEMGLGQHGVEYTKWEYLEFSPCGIPANPDALMNTLKSFPIELEKEDFDLMAAIKFMDENLIDILSRSVAEKRKPVPPCAGNVCCKDLSLEENIAERETLIKQMEEIIKGNDEFAPYLKPYPNEHACRLNPPDKYEDFRRGSRKHEGKTYNIIFGKVKGKDTWEEQAYRYPITGWDKEAAQAHCKAHNGMSFEPSSGKVFLSSDEHAPEVNYFSFVPENNVWKIATTSGTGCIDFNKTFDERMIKLSEELKSIEDKINQLSDKLSSLLPKKASENEDETDMYEKLLSQRMRIKNPL